MTADLEALLKLLSPLLIALISFALKRHFEEKPKLITYIIHADAVSVGGDANSSESIVNTHVVVVRNAGKKAAKNVRIGHYELPPGFKVSPPLAYSIARPPTGKAAEILIPTLSPNDQVVITYMYLPPLTWNQISAYAKSDEGSARGVKVISTPRPPKYAVGFLLFMAFIGASTVTYWTLVLIAYILAKTS